MNKLRANLQSNARENEGLKERFRRPMRRSRVRFETLRFIVPLFMVCFSCLRAKLSTFFFFFLYLCSYCLCFYLFDCLKISFVFVSFFSVFSSSYCIYPFRIFIFSSLFCIFLFRVHFSTFASFTFTN